MALTVNYPPKLAISSLVNRLKVVSSRLIRKRRYTCQQRKVLPENNFYRQNCDQATQLVLPTRKSKVILRQSLSCGVGLFGLQATMLAVVVALRLQFFGSTSKISVLQVEKAKIPVKELLISPS
ncbi:MAG: transposase [Lachnospiraceae bacterium]|nr:transposase [Lachnospiraceae bacterium]